MAKQKEKDVAPKDVSFEERMERLQEIVTILEQGEISLAESVGLYKEGLDLSGRCKEEIEKAKHEVKVLQNDGLENFSSEIDHSYNDDEIRF